MTTRTGWAARGLGDEAQDGEADEERVEGVVLGPSEYGVHRLALGFGEPPQTVEDRQHQLMDAGVPQGHLRLDPGDAQDPEPGRDVDRILHQRGLPDAGRTGEHERPALGTPGGREEAVDGRPFHDAADEGVACLRPLAGIEHARHGISSVAALSGDHHDGSVR